MGSPNIPLHYATKPAGIKERENSSFLSKMIAVYLFCAPLDFLQIIPTVSLPRFLVFLPLVSGILYIVKAKLRINRYFVALIVYLIVIALSMIYTVDLSVTKERTITVALNIAVILILSMFTYTKHELHIIRKAMVLSGWFTALLMIVYADTSLMYGRLTVIANGNYQDPNYLCGFLIYTIVHYWKAFLIGKKKRSLLYIGFFLVLVFMTGSRGGLIAVAGASLFYLFIWVKQSPAKGSVITKIMLLAVVAAVFIIALFAFLPEEITSRISINFTMKDRGANRFDIWKRAVYCFRVSPTQAKLFGWGGGTIRYFLVNEVAHNIWLESLLEIGIIGTASLLFLYGSYFIRSVRLKQYVAAACFFGYMIMTMSLSLYSYKPIWNILLLIILFNNTGEDLKKPQTGTLGSMGGIP